MSRNFYSEDDAQWVESNGMLTCLIDGKQAFCLYQDGHREELLNAFMKGRQIGQQEGADDLAYKLRLLLKAPGV